MPRLATRLRRVDFWPSSFARSRALALGGASPIELWGLRSRPVFLLYSDGLQASDPIPSNTPWARFWIARDVDPPPRMEPIPDTSEVAHRKPGEPPLQPVPAGLGMLEGFEVAVPHALVSMPSGPAQRQATLDLLHEQMLVLAHDLDWPLAPLQAAYEHCIRHELEFMRRGPEKSSPDRKRRAWIQASYDYDGDAWVTVHLAQGPTSRTLKVAFEADQGEWRNADLKAGLRWVDAVTIQIGALTSTDHVLDVHEL